MALITYGQVFVCYWGKNKIKQPTWKNNHHRTNFHAEAFSDLSESSLNNQTKNEQNGLDTEFSFQTFPRPQFPQFLSIWYTKIAVKFNIFISESAKKGEEEKTPGNSALKSPDVSFSFRSCALLRRKGHLHSLLPTQLFGKPYEDTISKLVFISLPRANIGWKTHT